jgi:hypothetical protein
VGGVIIFMRKQKEGLKEKFMANKKAGQKRNWFLAFLFAQKVKKWDNKNKKGVSKSSKLSELRIK